eukprot:6204720-Pleurochrysis_carterae.AAC.2
MRRACLRADAITADEEVVRDVLISAVLVADEDATLVRVHEVDLRRRARDSNYGRTERVANGAATVATGSQKSTRVET